jgi:hypothetical protein
MPSSDLSAVTPLDNKKKWRIVGIIAFALAWPLILGHADIVNDILRIAVCLLPPAAALCFLPFSQLVRGIVVIVYLALMYPAAMPATPAVDCPSGQSCL